MGKNKKKEPGLYCYSFPVDDKSYRGAKIGTMIAKTVFIGLVAVTIIWAIIHGVLFVQNPPDWFFDILPEWGG